jgi:hypothetical protein
MLKSSAILLAAGWALLVLLQVSGHLVWDNRLLWLPFSAFPASCMLALVAAGDADLRAPALLLAAAAFVSCLAFGLMYFFMFGLVG